MKVFPWSIQDHLKTNEERVAYFKAALEEDKDCPFENEQQYKEWLGHVLVDLGLSLGIELRVVEVKK